MPVPCVLILPPTNLSLWPSKETLLPDVDEANGKTGEHGVPNPVSHPKSVLLMLLLRLLLLLPRTVAHAAAAAAAVAAAAAAAAAAAMEEVLHRLEHNIAVYPITPFCNIGINRQFARHGPVT